MGIHFHLIPWDIKNVEFSHLWSSYRWSKMR